MRLSKLSRAMTTLSSLGLLLAAGKAEAFPHQGQHLDRTQPDGSVVQVVLWGDEFYVRAETPNGYTLVVDPDTQYITYAISSVDGALVSSGVVYDGVADDAELTALGIVKGADYSSTLRTALSDDKRNRLGPNWGKIAARLRSSGTYALSNVQPIAEPVPTGTVTGLVVLVDFPDRRNTISLSEVDKAFNSTDAYGGTWHGSIRKWSEQISGGITSVQHKVAGYYTAKNNVAYYNSPTAEWDYSTSDELYEEVYAYIEANVDLSAYAVGGKLPSLALIYAGGIIARDWAMALWPHGGCGGWGYRTSEGVTIDRCFLTNLGTNVPLADLETFRHELGHSVFSWPDTYDYDSDSESAGGFATETDMPCAPFRMWAGWITPTNVTSKTGVYSLDANGSTVLRYNNASISKEYFVAEYAKRDAWRSPPDEGLLIWHIDENGDNSWQDMTPTRHYAMSVEQADGLYHLEKNVRAGSGDLFHAGDKPNFDDTTTPNGHWWNGSSSGFKLCQIGGITSTTMSVNVGCVAAGGSSGTGGSSSTGGATSKGGSSSTGGATSKGGSSSTGGATSKGGSSSTGGTTNKGGTTSKGGTSAATGGTTYAANGGTANALGGTSNATGGSRPSTGGTGSGNGGSIAVNSGTVIGSTAGTSAVAGFSNSGGQSAIPVGTAGTVTGVGGATSTLVGTTTAADPAVSGEDGGCGCRVTGGNRSNSPIGVFGAMGVLALGLRRRRRP